MVIDDSQWIRMPSAPADTERREFLLVGRWNGTASRTEHLYLCCNTLYRERSWVEFAGKRAVWFQHVGVENARLPNESQRPAPPPPLPGETK